MQSTLTLWRLDSVEYVIFKTFKYYNNNIILLTESRWTV